MRVDAHRVAPGLWVGAAPYDSRPIDGVDAAFVVARERQAFRSWAPVVEHVALDDAIPSAREVVMAREAARRVHRLRMQGQRVLVMCNQGVNRFSLVAALALMVFVELLFNEQRAKLMGRPVASRWPT